MSQKIFILLGVGDSGKTKTIKAFFGVDNRYKTRSILEIGGEEFTIYMVLLGSPQERNEFCDVENVNIDIQNRLDYCEVRDANYMLLIPFTIKRNFDDRSLNENCISELPRSKLRGVKCRPV